MGLVQSNATQDLQFKTVWYGGTSTLKEGQIVAYDTSDTTAPVTAAASPTATTERNVRGRRVVDPATAVLGGFAGVITAQSAGAVGPCFIEIIVPRKGDICFIYTNINATKNSSLLGMTNAGGLTAVTIADATINVDLIAIAMETVDRSGTSGLVLSRFF